MIKKDTITNLLEKRKWILFSLLFVVTVILILFLPKYLSLVEFLGKRIPQENIKLDYIKGFLWAIFLGLTILIWPVRSQDKKTLMWIWAVKCFVMLGLMLYYEYHYQTDAFAYFADSKHDISQWKAMFSAGPNFPVSTIIWLQNTLFLNSFHAAKVSFGMIGFIAIYIFYRSIVAFLQKEKLSLLYFFALFPSIMLWSSIVGKEPLYLLFIVIYCYGVIRWFRTNFLVYIFCALLGILLLSFFRDWMGPILILPLLISTLIYTGKNRKIKIVAIIVLSLTSLYFIDQFLKHFNLKSGKDLTSQANIKSNNFARGGSSIITKEIESNTSVKVVRQEIESNTSVKVVRQEIESNTSVKASSVEVADKVKFHSLREMILYIPQGIFTVLFRPLPGEVYNIFGFLAGIEGAFLLILFALAIKRIRWRELSDPIIIWAVLLIVIWAAVYSFVGFNLGTVYRYRLQILPVFLGLLFYQARSRNK